MFLLALLLLVCDDNAGNASQRLPDLKLEAQRRATSPLHSDSAPFWLGVSCVNVPEFARQQLDLGGGVVVGCVAEGSPGAKADLQKHDILLRLNDEAIDDVCDLVKLIQATQGERSVLTVMRRGQLESLTIQPERRPSRPTKVAVVDPEGKPLCEESAKLLDDLHRGEATESISIVVVRPGLVIPQESLPAIGVRLPLTESGTPSMLAPPFPEASPLDRPTLTLPMSVTNLDVVQEQAKAIQQGTVCVNNREIELFPGLPASLDQRAPNVAAGPVSPQPQWLPPAGAPVSTPRIRIVQLIDEPETPRIETGSFHAYVGETDDVERLRQRAMELQGHLESISAELRRLQDELRRLEE